jgi:hypothetical protein
MRFPAKKVRITRVYLVDCDECDAVTPDLTACTTRREADEARQNHIDWHRAGEPSAWDKTS